MTTASWYHARLKPLGRSAGRSAVACAAYRTGSSMVDQRYAAIRDFSRKADVVIAFTLAPEGSPAWAVDAEALWNAVEAKEKRKDSQLAFEWEVALPNELTADQREAIARGFTKWLVDEYGVAVTTGIHEGGNRGNGLNDHMHVMMTTRAVGPDGFAAKKLLHFSTPPGKANPEVDRVREEIAARINVALEEAGSDSQVDHRSFKARGIDREPTTHLGPAATWMERKHAGISDRADINRAIIEERLAWQQDQAQPEIRAALEREFSERWGDAPKPDDHIAAEPTANPAAAPTTDPRDLHADRAQAHVRRYEEAARQARQEAEDEENRRAAMPARPALAAVLARHIERAAQHLHRFADWLRAAPRDLWDSLRGLSQRRRDDRDAEREQDRHRGPER